MRGEHFTTELHCSLQEFGFYSKGAGSWVEPSLYSDLAPVALHSASSLAAAAFCPQSSSSGILDGSISFCSPRWLGLTLF